MVSCAITKLKHMSWSTCEVVLRDGRKTSASTFEAAKRLRRGAAGNKEIGLIGFKTADSEIAQAPIDHSKQAKDEMMKF